jgi:hypothetical protein
VNSSNLAIITVTYLPGDTEEYHEKLQDLQECYPLDHMQ